MDDISSVGVGILLFWERQQAEPEHEGQVLLQQTAEQTRKEIKQSGVETF